MNDWPEEDERENYETLDNWAKSVAYFRDRLVEHGFSEEATTALCCAYIRNAMLQRVSLDSQ